jgi:hypothetical protein
MTTRARRRTPTPPARPTAITELGARTPFKKWIIYADSGGGKTVLGGTAPDNIFLEFDPEGTESAEVFGSTSKVWQIPNWSEWQEALDYFKRGSGCEDFNWVTIDTLTEGEDVCWSDHLALQHARKPSTRSLYKPALDDYPQVWNKVKALVEDFNRLPINVLYTAHVLAIPRWDDDREEDYEELMPLVGSTKNGVLSRKICAKVSLVGYLDVKRRRDEEGNIEQFRRLYVNKRRDMIAKNRYGWGNYLDDPTMPQLIGAADKARSGAPSTPPRRRPRRTA